MVTTQPEALRLDAALTRAVEQESPDDDTIVVARWFVEDAAAELRRLHRHELALQCWLDKTNWVQETAQDGELGMHRADVLKKRIDALTESNQELLEALQTVLSESHDGPLHDDYRRQARAAIAKAERTTT